MYEKKLENRAEGGTDSRLGLEDHPKESAYQGWSDMRAVAKEASVNTISATCNLQKKVFMVSGRDYWQPCENGQVTKGYDWSDFAEILDARGYRSRLVYYDFNSRT